MTTFLDTAAADRFDTEVLQQHWIPLARKDIDTAAVLRERLGVDFTAIREEGGAAGNFRYLPVVACYERGETVEHETIVFALGSEFLVTLQPSEHFLPFDKAITMMCRRPALAGSTYGVMYALLWALNEASERVIQHAGDALETMNSEIDAAACAADRRDHEMGEGGLGVTLLRMNAVEQVISRTRKTQWQLARATRHLRAGTPAGQGELDGPIDLLLTDIDGVGQYASLMHDKVRYLQRSVTALLDTTQRQSIRMLTLCGAVLLPPALVVVSVPELPWQHRFLVAVVIPLVAAVILLTCAKKKDR
ncbi:CorA family divalent cation transporter [Nocardia sp. 004]|uniref:CorA family divalent cation transporter n=1 Tax=Nocardia sp. 004 TaxID=3385978 RepID=UPI0039A34F86